MLPKLRRISSNNDKSTDSNSSGKSTDDSTVYVETLLYIVHVDDIDVPIPMNEKIKEEMYDGGDEQQITPSNQIVRRFSKRTTASFNERHQLTKPSFTFSNPLRRLNSKLNFSSLCILFSKSIRFITIKSSIDVNSKSNIECRKSK